MASETYAEGNTVRVAEDYDGAARHVERARTTRARDDESCDSWSDEHYEQIDGVVYQMAGPRLSHCRVVGNISWVIRGRFKGKKCQVFSQDYVFFYHPNIEDDKKKEDFLQPDVMIACDTDQMKDDGYYGVPRFVVEVLSPSNSKHDKTLKFGIYESCGVSEYWVVNPIGVIDIYYLVNGRYRLEQSYTFCRNKESKDYNADQVITLREFPEVSVTVGEIFE